MELQCTYKLLHYRILKNTRSLFIGHSRDKYFRLMYSQVHRVMLWCFSNTHLHVGSDSSVGQRFSFLSQLVASLLDASLRDWPPSLTCSLTALFPHLHKLILGCALV